MRYLYIFLLAIVIGNGACKKNETASGNCQKAVVTQSGTLCNGWAIRTMSGTTYLSTNIPDQFKQEGLDVCTEYELYEDLRLCSCCGGTWANIRSMKLFVR